jgi:hypothetical protein
LQSHPWSRRILMIAHKPLTYILNLSTSLDPHSIKVRSRRNICDQMLLGSTVVPMTVWSERYPFLTSFIAT